MTTELKAPFPYFGGKSKIAEQVWTLFGDVKNYIEPFAGSAAVLLARPQGFKGPETLNDFSCFVVNAWRAIRDNPEALAERLVGPVCEVNTEAEHAALMRSGEGLRDRLGDPGYSDLALAAYWIRGANEWIGSGWAGGEGPWSWSRATGWQKRDRQLPHLGDAGKGINRKLPHLGDAGTGQYEQRVEWVTSWLCALRDRLCEVRIACGDFERVLGDSSTTKHGLTGVFLDPPYDGTEYVYGTKVPVSERVFDWCLESTKTPLLRIVLAGRGTEHDTLLRHGWGKSVWTTNRGYSKDTNKGRNEETLWYSPSCVTANGADTDLL